MAESMDMRIGTVTAVNEEACRVRVKFQDTGISSGWLPVLQRGGEKVYVQPSGSHDHKVSGGDGSVKVESSATKPHTEYDRDGQSMSAAGTSHNHLAEVTKWLPQINDTVLCLYLPAFNADGFVLGGIV